MIDEKKLIDELKQRGMIADNEYGNAMVDMIESQSKIGGWIPCSERLPENDNYILLSFENFTIPLVGRYEEDESGGAFYVGDDEESCISQNIIVNAWRELPEPYKEQVR